MAYEVLARKWRPRQFDDVVGQEHVTRTLKNAIKADRVAHAYLFVGSRGIGKTSTARILAKSLNCEKGPTPEPCDNCDACREIMAGNAMDVLEIDGASNNGVDEVRGLRENVRYTPARGPYKIYVIDEVHMLTVAAFNALLKTLEEPPPHVKFIFATTEPQKVPATILSRCQRFDLRRISVRDLTARLELIAGAEKLDIDTDALLAIARGAEGGLRDAESALDQLIAFVGRKIREENVLSVFGLVARKTLDELVGTVLKGEIPRTIRIIAELDESGKDMQRLVVELLEYFRNILIYLYAGEGDGILDLSDEQLGILEAHAQSTDPERVLRIVNILTEVDGRLRYALSKRTILETALIRAGRAASVVSIDQVIEQINDIKKNGSMIDPGLSAKEKPQSSDPSVSGKDDVSAPTQSSTVTASRASDEPSEKELNILIGSWTELIDQISHAAPLARSCLIDSRPVMVQGHTVEIGFDPEFESHIENLDVPRNRNAIQRVIGSVLGRNIHVDFKLLEAGEKLPGDTEIKPAVKGEGENMKHGADLDENVQKATHAREKWLRDPSVRKTLEVFNGDIVDVRE